MALIGRLIVIFFAFLAACLVAGMIIVGAVLFPEFTDLGTGPMHRFGAAPGDRAVIRDADNKRLLAAEDRSMRRLGGLLRHFARLPVSGVLRRRCDDAHRPQGSRRRRMRGG